MCNYASMAGSGLQSAASAHEAMDMAKAFQSEQVRQNRYRDQAAGNFNNLVGTSGYGAYQQDATAGQANRENIYNQLANTRMSLSPTLGKSTDLAAEQLAGQAQAKLGGYGDYQQAQGIRQLGSQRNLNQIGDFAAGTASVFPYRMYEAQHGWDWMSALGSIVGSFGGASGGTNFGSGPSGSQMPAAGTGGNLNEYGGGYNPNLGALDQSVGASPYVYYQMPTVQNTAGQDITTFY